jgi:8-oxo-dGTP diphosphatase
MAQPKIVSAGIAIEGGCVLLTRRAPGQTLEGMWEFPGGKQEYGESIQECLQRELREELGVDATTGEIIAESIYEYPGGAIRLVAIVTTLSSKDFSLTVHDRAEWPRVSDILEYDLAPADVPIAKEIIKRHG